MPWGRTLFFRTVVPDTPGSKKSPVILWSSDDPHCSVLASAVLVSGTSGSSSGWSSSASFVSRSAQTASFPSPSSRNIQAVPSCVETLQRFARWQGFSSHVTKQIAFSHRPSSCAGYRAKWSVFRSCVIPRAILFPILLF